MSFFGREFSVLRELTNDKVCSGLIALDISIGGNSNTTY